MNRPVLICYDGSADARHAIVQAARLRPGTPAVVLNVWHSETAVYPTALHAGMAPVPGEEATVNERRRSRSAAVGAEGVALARRAGLTAAARSEREESSIWETIIAVADELDADLVVTGSRGLGKLRSLLMGSVSDRLLHHCRRPTLVVPSPELAEDRAAAGSTA
jgi:nucleotide-binding universal stress UspA family protein